MKLEIRAAVKSSVREIQLLSQEGEQSDVPKVFQWVSLVLPARLYKEDLGDALELLAKLERAGAPRWQRGFKIACTCFWLLISTVKELTSVVHGGGAKQRGGDR